MKILKEKRKEKSYQSIIKNLEKKLFNVLRELDTAKDKIKEQRGELYDVKTQLEEEKGKNQQLHAQINRDYENSSIPSSKTVRHKKITNSREKTEENRGYRPVTNTMEERNRHQPGRQSHLCLHRKYWKIRILNQPANLSRNSW